ncbi:methyltransferase [Enterococcus phage SAP6]|uniref:Methyltransferase n=1 Tax=Enterococcus phage SAP6 TaxID=1073766 RepID=G1C4W5_9CAUD|nr:methyltransferase [Enterococcus phage SAP6]AEM24747.1 methyltransferase [Enterococcus phage SAP6]
MKLKLSASITILLQSLPKSLSKTRLESFNMSKLPFENELKEALNKPTLTQRETALTALVGKLQDALVDSNWDKILAEQWYEEAIEDVRGIDSDLEEASLEIESLESEIQHLEEQIYDLENELESSEETVEELTEEVDTLSERVEELESIIESLED